MALEISSDSALIVFEGSTKYCSGMLLNLDQVRKSKPNGDYLRDDMLQGCQPSTAWGDVSS